MPMLETTEIPSPDQLSDTQYLIFYASRNENGMMWCPDCRDVENLVMNTFGSAGPTALVFYVGHKSEWKTPTNAARMSSWKVDSVPTIIKLTHGHEVARLGDTEVKSGLPEFVKGDP